MEQKWRDFIRDGSGPFSKGSKGSKQKLVEERQAVDKAIDELLDARQNARFRQIELQQVRAEGR